MKINSLYIMFKKIARNKGKDAFVLKLAAGAKMIDVGCGNNSPIRVKSLRPDLYYIGIDVQNYEQSKSSITAADEYRLVDSVNFSSAIRVNEQSVDAILSSHNLEHCQFQDEVLIAMCMALKPSGLMYLSYPTEESVNFPRRAGTLNYYDDRTHNDLPPSTDKVLNILSSHGMQIQFVIRRYRPLLPLLLGIILEPFSMLFGKVAPLGSTWALYGFETVIWAKKSHDLK